MNVSVKEAALLLSVSEKTIYRWIKQEAVPAYRVKGQHRFNRAELLEWATSRRMGVSPELLYEKAEETAALLPTLTESLEAGGIIYRLGGATRDEVLENLVGQLHLPEEVDRDYLFRVLAARENLASTGVGDGIALPHPRNPVLLHISRPTVTLAFLENPIDFGALDGRPVNVLFCLISPTLRAHLHLLSMLGFALHARGFRSALKSEGSRDEILSALGRVKRGMRRLKTEEDERS